METFANALRRLANLLDDDYSNNKQIVINELIHILFYISR